MSQIKEKKNIGILGGSFDPVHAGHIALALDAIDQGHLDQVWIMPAKVQPFKQDKEVVPAAHRLAMLQLAIEDQEDLAISTLEMELEGVSYTYRTLREARKTLPPDGHLYFITGADSFIKMDTWMNAQDLLKENSVIVGQRPGYLEKEVQEAKNRFEALYGTEVILLQNHLLDISSTEIVRRLHQGESIQGLVPPKVETYIYQKGLYSKPSL